MVKIVLFQADFVCLEQQQKKNSTLMITLSLNARIEFYLKSMSAVILNKIE